MNALTVRRPQLVYTENILLTSICILCTSFDKVLPVHLVHVFICRTRFLVLNYAEKFEETMKKLAELVLSGKIKVNI